MYISRNTKKGYVIDSCLFLLMLFIYDVEIRAQRFQTLYTQATLTSSDKTVNIKRISSTLFTSFEVTQHQPPTLFHQYRNPWCFFTCFFFLLSFMLLLQFSLCSMPELPSFLLCSTFWGCRHNIRLEFRSLVLSP